MEATMLMTNGVRRGLLRRAEHHEKLAENAAGSELAFFAEYHRQMAEDFRKAALAEEPQVLLELAPVDRVILHPVATVLFWILVIGSGAYWLWVFLNWVNAR